MTGASGLRLDVLQRALSFIALTLVGAIAWWFLIASEAAMTSMHGDGLIMRLMWAMMEPGAMPGYLTAAALMWVVMMIAMMVPAVLPVAMIFRGMRRGAGASLDTLLFAGGYLGGWCVFALFAAALQWWLHSDGFLHGNLLEIGPVGAAAILIVAGLYQLTPLKEACLAHCRSPLGFLMAHWRDGHAGAFRMGLEHGVFCIGCCWVLMALMFVGGAMSVATMAALCIFILAERLLPSGPWVARVPGLIMVATGAGVLITA